MDLAERQTQLAELDAALQDARRGQGSIVLVTGEAGSGKTALVRCFASAIGQESRILWGMCDELATPRPLGPFRDMATQLGDTPYALGEESAGAVLDALLHELGRSPRATVAFVEDAHWADGATLDGIRFLGRRIRRKPALLVVTFRGDEVPADHPLRLAMGAIPPDDIRRIPLAPLSRHGVEQLAGSDEVDDLYHLTGGNPFYVTEALAAPGSAVPETVQDAIMARLGRLGDRGLAAVEIASVVPGHAERWVLDACGAADGLNEAARVGVLEVDIDTIRFTHELTRRAVEGQLEPERRAKLNRAVLEVLAEHGGAEPARMTHHAVEAADPSMIGRFAPAAARRARSLNSHREAAAHFRQALDHAEQYSDDDQAALWLEYARECNLTSRHDVAQEAATRAAELYEAIGNREQLGSCLSLLSEALWYAGRGKDAHEALSRATAILEQLPPGHALAWVYAQQSRLAMVDRRFDESTTWGKKAIELARQLDDATVQTHALNTTGLARWLAPPFDNRDVLESLTLARANGLAIQVSRALSNLVSGHLHRLEFAEAGRYLDEGLAFCTEHDILTAHTWLLAHKAVRHLELGQWAEAEGDAERALEASDARNLTACLTLGLLQTRRGSPQAESTLAEAQGLADSIGDTQNLIPVGMARLEWAWLHGSLDESSGLAMSLFERAQRAGYDLLPDESAIWVWLHRAGVVAEPPRGLFEPYALQISGRWREAANAWAELGRIYAQADALADAREQAPLLEALEILDQLGATPRGAMVRRKLAELGVVSVPRGPRQSTRSNPAGLTTRQTEVLRLLAEGLTYQQIAERLYLSVKTVDHHAAAARAKLDAATRHEAVDTARRLGILSADGL